MAPSIDELLDTYQDGYALARPFYTDPDLYTAELDRIWYRDWLFAAVSCEISRPGDYVVYEIGTESVIVVRREDGGVSAHHNVCRHRGSIIATESRGRARSLTCPYHQWSYGLDGSLRRCRAVPDDFDKSAHGLRPVHVRELDGLVYISLADEPVDFDPVRTTLGPMARPQGLASAKVAHSIDYEIAANWKLVWENNRECFHCVANHPQYVLANYDRYDEIDLNDRIEREIDEATARSQAKWAACGLTAGVFAGGGLAQFPSPDGTIWYSANRTAMVPGYLSESMDGTPVAPLMGSYPDPDIGVLRLRTLPNFWHHGSCDHSVITRLTPNGPRSTKATVSWLVDADAEPGTDYDLGRLLPFWQLTSEQDWLICERQQRGVESRAYTPGPLSAAKEYNVVNFHAWYLRSLRNGV